MLTTISARLGVRCWIAGSLLLSAAVGAGAVGAAASRGGTELGPVSFAGLLEELTNREAVARFPSYTCSQFSSYDRASKTPDDPKTWFANGDHSQYLRVETVDGRKEFVMMDTDGPGAIVRLWSANPGGTLRVYIDGAAKPVIEAPMTDVLGGKWLVGAPLAAERAKGWNLYMPIPYHAHCKVTSDKGDFYYQINYRTYEKGTVVASYTAQDPEKFKAALDRAQKTLMDPQPAEAGSEGASGTPVKIGTLGRLAPHATRKIPVDAKGASAAISELKMKLDAPNQAQARRSTVISVSFDGEQCIWGPVGGFFGADVGVKQHQDWWRTITPEGEMTCRWVMPFQKSCEIALENLSEETVEFEISAQTIPWKWDDRSMHFHSAWRHQFPIHAYGGRGTMDWNYVTVTGKGVYMGDTLAVMNPVDAWWGEGDEKIYVDGETFPSHFGTGTEDYYGYAWCWPQVFSSPFNGQPRVDGEAKKNNWGHTTVTRVRDLDAIPFSKSLRFDMEIWHWKECDEAYAVTTYFYGAPGTTANVKPAPEEAKRKIPEAPPPPPPMKVAGAIECEGIKEVNASPGVTVIAQDGFGPNVWSEDKQLWVQGRKVGDFVQLTIPAPDTSPHSLTIYATRSWDYGIVRFVVNGQKAGEDVDLFNAKGHDVAATGPIKLGSFTPVKGCFVIRAEVVGANPKSEGTKSFFGLDCIVLDQK